MTDDQSLRARLASTVEDSAATEPVDPNIRVIPASGEAPRLLAEEPVAAAATSPDAGTRTRTQRIAPHAARTAHRARRTWYSAIGIPFFGIYTLIEAVRDVRDAYVTARKREVERRPAFRRPADMPAPDDRSMPEIVAAIEAVPFEPSKMSSQVTFLRDHGPDMIGALLSPNPQVSTLPHFYPATFDQRLFTGDEGVHLAGMQAMHEHRGPAVVICHGLLMTKNYDMIISLARRAFEKWGFHVVTLDLRGWGQSQWTTDAPSSAGYHEGRDIIAVARELHLDERVTTVAAIGLSLGGASVTNAAYVSSQSEDRPLDGGAVAVSSPTEVGTALEHISTKPDWRDPYYGLWHVFRAAIKGTVRRRGLSRDLRTWRDLVGVMSAPYYGVEMDEFCRRASSRTFAADIDQPVLHLHSTDDFLVPVSHAVALEEAVRDNPWVHVIIKDFGSHVAFNAADRRWFNTVLRHWLEYWAEDAPESGDGPEDLDAVVG